MKRLICAISVLLYRVKQIYKIDLFLNSEESRQFIAEFFKISNPWIRQDNLPFILRAYIITPVTFLCIVIFGLLFSLPPGPLSDEGMILFMEGGCDWGASNIFFFSKLGLLIIANIGFWMVKIKKVEDCRPLLPHFLILLILALIFCNDERCNSYYAHPNGSLGQMVIEIIAFTWSGIGAAKLVADKTFWKSFIVWSLWNGMYWGIFYTGLLFTNHWTWTHTITVSSFMILIGVILNRSFLREDFFLIRN